jgi:hypothetical protein
MSLGNIKMKILNTQDPLCKIRESGKNREQYVRGIAIRSQTNCILFIKQTNGIVAIVRTHVEDTVDFCRKSRRKNISETQV